MKILFFQKPSGKRPVEQLLVKRQKTIVLLHAYKKQSQKAPKKEIETAMNRMLEVYRHESVYT